MLHNIRGFTVPILDQYFTMPYYQYWTNMSFRPHTNHILTPFTDHIKTTHQSDQFVNYYWVGVCHFKARGKMLAFLYHSNFAYMYLFESFIIQRQMFCPNVKRLPGVFPLHRVGGVQTSNTGPVATTAMDLQALKILAWPSPSGNLHFSQQWNTPWKFQSGSPARLLTAESPGHEFCWAQVPVQGNNRKNPLLLQAELHFTENDSFTPKSDQSHSMKNLAVHTQ